MGKQFKFGTKKKNWGTAVRLPNLVMSEKDST